MSLDTYSERFLFGGAISSCFPIRFQDVSNIREVPDHQEVFVDPSRDESLIFELLDFKNDVEDKDSAVWFLKDIAREQDDEDEVVLDHLGALEATSLHGNNGRVTAAIAIGQLNISKGRQGREARNLVRLYLANFRLKDVGTDLLISAYEPLVINPLSESCSTVGPGPSIPAAQLGYSPVSDVFNLAVARLVVHDWGLFGQE